MQELGKTRFNRLTYMESSL